MLSLGGAIGTGLFWVQGSHFTNWTYWRNYCLYSWGAIAYMVMLCLGELAVHMPFRVLSAHTLESTLVQVQVT